MQTIDKQTTVEVEPCVATIGFFDGVHLGHRFLVQQLVEEAHKRGLKSGIVSFPVHPGKVMNPLLKLSHLSVKQEKLELLAQTDLDYCFLLDFTKELSQFTAYDFMRKVLRDQFQVRVLVIGYDHRFGHNRAEGFEDYCRYGKELGIEVLQAKAYYKDGVDVSSTAIRNALEEANLEEVKKYLGYSYFVRGTVIQGKKLGRTIGFPTANVGEIAEDKLLPKDGVYAVKVEIEGFAKDYWGMLNIGVCPTVDSKAIRTVEVNILDFKADIYGAKIKLSFMKWLRPEVKFETLDLLIEQLHQDEKDVRQLIASYAE